MLDFYYIDDEIKKPEYPEKINLKFAFGLGYENFIDLQNHKIISSRFDYYSDFRWSTKLVVQILQSIENKENNFNKNIEKLKKELDKTLELKTGLIAFSD